MCPGKEILIVDDDPTLRMVAVFQLEKLGFKPQTAANGLEAVRLAACTSFKLILMDLQMPFMDGFEATAAIRLYETENRRPPARIVALTANGNTDREKCFQAGMNAFHLKPTCLADLRNIIDTWMR